MSASPRPFDHDHLPPGVDPPAKDDPRELGGYSIVGRIGVGGMGAVYAGVGPQGGCAAVKVIHPQFATDPLFLARFAREVELVSRVRGTCTAAFHGADVQAATPWMATEYVPGRTLRQHVRENGPLEGGLLTALAVGLAEALAAIHEAGIVHRDLKPGNVILSPQGPKVLDFGIARAVDATALTQTGGLVGTPGWIAPEQYAGAEASAQSDMFAWGGMVAFAATGRNPFGTGDAEAVIHRTRAEEPDLRGVPAELLDLVRRAMDKDPRQRPTTGQALAELMAGWSTTRVATVVPEAPTQLVPEFLATQWRGVTAPEARRVKRPRGRLLPVAVSAGAVAAVLVLVLLAVRLIGLPGFAEEPDGQEASGGGATPDETGAEAQATVDDGPAMLDQATALVTDATGFDAYTVSISGGPESASSARFQYTESPEPLYLRTAWAGPALSEVLEVGDGPDDVIHRIVSFDALSQGLEVGGYYRDPDGVTDYDEPLDRHELVEDIAWIADSDVAADYLGETAPPETTSDFMADTADHGRVDRATGHQYTGAFVRERVAPDGTSSGDYEYTFDVWLDEDGYPLVLQLFYGPAEGGSGAVQTTTMTYLGFNEPVDIQVPEESEIAPNRESVGTTTT